MNLVARVIFAFLLLVTAMLGSPPLWAQTPEVENFDASVEKMADLLLELRPAGVELGGKAVADPALLSALAPNQSEKQVECLRAALSRDAFRKRKLDQVRAYAEIDRSRFSGEYSMFHDRMATVLREFERGRSVDTFDDQQKQLLAAFFYDPQYRPLRRLTEYTYLERSILSNYSARILQEVGTRSMALAMEPAFQSCGVPLTKWLEEVITLTAGLADPTELTPEFGRKCGAPVAVAEQDSSNKTVSPPRTDPKKPVEPPTYAQLARRFSFEGTVVVKVLVNERGETVNAAVDRSSGYIILDAAAVKSTRDWRFIPARKDGKAVCMDVLRSIVFKLSD